MNYQKFLASTAVVTLAATAVTPLASASTLTDIKGHTYEKEIAELVNRGVISGYKDNTFRPNKTLTRSDVTKILGKYLVSLGYDIPSDYKTNIRFNDLSKRSNDELLKYAALVKDVGVFNGDRGRLLADKQLTNEQAANVLVRAFTKIDAFDYVTFVEQQTFFKDFIDTENLTGESKQSIHVIDYYDIVSRNNFYPKQAIKRGAFASMLHNMIDIQKSGTITKLAVRNIIAVTPTRLTVTLSDNTTHNVYLPEPLQENVSTAVTFTINGEEFSGRATYYTKQLEITDIENKNGGQFIVHFNQEVDLPTTQSANDLAKIFTLTKTGTSTTSPFLKGELSNDKKSFTVTLSSQTPLNGTYRLNIKGIRALNGKSLADFDESVYFVNDTTKPFVTAVENLSPTLIKVTFNEPVYTNYSTITYTRDTGATIYGITASANDKSYVGYENKTEILFDLKGAYLPNFTYVNAKLSGLRDVAGNYIGTNGDTTITMRSGGPDGVAPKLLSIEQLAAKQLKLTFDEAMDTLYSYQLNVSGNDDYYYVEDVKRVAGDAASFIVTVDNYLDGMLTISSNASYPVKDATGTTGTFSKSQLFDYDTTRASIETTETLREDNMLYLYVYFDRNVVVDEAAKATIQGSYLYKDTNVTMSNPQAATVYATNDPRVVKIPVKELVKNYDRLDSIVSGELTFNNVLNEYRQPVQQGYVQFQRKADTVYNTEVLQLLSVETSRTSKDITNSNQLLLNFNYPLDAQGVDDLFNYDLTGYTLKSAELNRSNPRQVILTIDSAITQPVEPYLYVYNLKSESSMLDMVTYYERVYLNENVAPTYVTYDVMNANQIRLTFSEALNPIDPRTFYVEDSAGIGSVANAAIDPTNSSRVILTLDKALIRNSTMKIRLMPGRTITDQFYNVLTFNETTINTGWIN